MRWDRPQIHTCIPPTIVDSRWCNNGVLNTIAEITKSKMSVDTTKR